MSTRSSSTSYDLAILVAPRIVGKNSGWGPLVKHASFSKVGSLNNSVTTTPDSVGDWRQRIAAHKSATTVLSGTRYVILAPGGGSFKWEAFSKATGNRVNGLWVAGALTNPTTVNALPAVPSMTHVDNQALTKWIARAYSAQVTLQSAVVAGELGSTLRGIVSPLKSLRKGIVDYLLNVERNAWRAARRQRSTGKIDSLRGAEKRKAIQRAITGTYLEAVFGWRPLVSDIDSAAKAAARIITYRPPTEYVLGQASDSGLTSPNVNVQNMGLTFLRNVFENKYEYSCKIYGVLINRSGWNGALGDLGLLPRNFIPSLYQLIPYSFVVDYFTNLGTIVEAAALNRANIAWVNRGTQQIRRKQAVSCEGLTPAINPLLTREVLSFSPGRMFAITLTTVTRSPYVGSLIPSLEFTIPGLGTKWINMAALVAQARATSRRIARL